MLTFAGNVTLQAGATTRIDVDGSLQVPGGPGTFDRVVVSGATHGVLRACKKRAHSSTPQPGSPLNTTGVLRFAMRSRRC